MCSWRDRWGPTWGGGCKQPASHHPEARRGPLPAGVCSGTGAPGVLPGSSGDASRRQPALGVKGVCEAQLKCELTCAEEGEDFKGRAREPRSGSGDRWAGSWAAGQPGGCGWGAWPGGGTYLLPHEALAPLPLHSPAHLGITHPPSVSSAPSLAGSSGRRAPLSEAQATAAEWVSQDDSLALTPGCARQDGELRKPQGFGGTQVARESQSWREAGDGVGAHHGRHEGQLVGDEKEHIAEIRASILGGGP